MFGIRDDIRRKSWETNAILAKYPPTLFPLKNVLMIQMFAATLKYYLILVSTL